MKYLEVDEARHVPGVRLVLSKGFPGPWGQAVKKMLELKGVAYVAVAQYAGQANEALLAWTGHRNAPLILVDDEPPITRWADQILFAERQAPEPPLLPRASAERAAVFGIVNELAGEWGLGWCRRLMLFADVADDVSRSPLLGAMGQAYGYDPHAVAAAPARIVDILGMLTERLREQRVEGSDYLVGERLTAADIYWAAFSTMIEPLPDRLAPMTEELRRSRTPTHPLIVAARDPILLAHRDLMFDRHLGPIDF